MGTLKAETHHIDARQVRCVCGAAEAPAHLLAVNLAVPIHVNVAELTLQCTGTIHST
jgi:hypothetical protein